MDLYASLHVKQPSSKQIDDLIVWQCLVSVSDLASRASNYGHQGRLFCNRDDSNESIFSPRLVECSCITCRCRCCSIMQLPSLKVVRRPFPAGSHRPHFPLRGRPRIGRAQSALILRSDCISGMGNGPDSTKRHCCQQPTQMLRQCKQAHCEAQR